MKELGKNLRALRKALGLTIYDVERQTGISFSLVSAYERGQRRPSLENARRLANFYQVPVAQLLLSPEEVAQCLPPELREITDLFFRRPELRELVATLATLPPEAVRNLNGFLAHVLSLSQERNEQDSRR